MSFTYAELFAGILGFGTALDDLGGEPVFISENDRYAQQAIHALGRGDLLHGDITKIDAAAVPDHDLLVGGFPCQAFSVAGRRLGFDDMRGTLFFEAVRIAKEKRPKVILLENVKGLVNHAKGETISVMLHALNDIDYVVDMQILNSKYFGVPQHRERLFIVAIREDLADPEEWTDAIGGNVLQKAKKRLQAEGLVTFNFDWPEKQEVRAALRDVLEKDVPDRYYLAEDKTAKLIARLEMESRQELPEPSPVMVGHVEGSGHDICKRVYSVDGASPTVPTGSSGNTTPKIAEPVMIGSLDYYGNDQMNRVYSVDGISPTITVVSGGGREKKILSSSGTKYRVRKLTPRETWRLQSFSDAAFDRVKASGMSNSQLYKQAGNAVTVNVIRAIAKQLLPFLH